MRPSRESITPDLQPRVNVQNALENQRLIFAQILRLQRERHEQRSAFLIQDFIADRREVQETEGAITNIYRRIIYLALFIIGALFLALYYTSVLLGNCKNKLQ